MSKFQKLPKGMIEQLQFLQQQLMSAQAELSGETVTGTAGGGAVTVTLTGDQRCKEVLIDPELLKDADAAMLQDLILTAMNNALEEMRSLAAERMSPFTDFGT